MSLSGLTRQSLFAALLVIPLLFTSCLADALNKKFGYQVPVYVYYSSEQSSAPAKRKIPTGQPLADEDLPSLEAQGWIFGGWYSDKEYTSKMESGIVLEIGGCVNKICVIAILCESRSGINSNCPIS